MTGRKVRDARDARACLAAVEASGLTRRRWAEAHGVDARSLNAWRINLGRTATRRPTGALVELVPTLPPARTGRYRVLCGELAVEVDADFDVDVLRRLLAVVASC